MRIHTHLGGYVHWYIVCVYMHILFVCCIYVYFSLWMYVSIKYGLTLKDQLCGTDPHLISFVQKSNHIEC